jgi:hypothetical protein
MAIAASGREGLARTVAGAVLAFVTGLNVAGPLLTVLAGEPLWPNGVAGLALYPFAVVGALIVFRRPHNLVAWVCLMVGLGVALEGALWGAALYGFARPGAVPGPEVLAVLGDAFVMPSLFLIPTLLLLLFPDGRLPSPRWRWVAWLSGALLAGGLVTGLFVPETGGWGRPTVANPLALDGAEFLDVVFLALFGCVAAAVVAVVRRFRSATGIVRLQLRWLASAGVCAILMWLVAIVVVADGDEQAAVALTLGGFALIPVAIGVAVLRYRLFEIDRLVSRTLTYALVVSVLVVVFAGGVLLVSSLFPLQGELAVAASTLAVAALFNPLRRRVQSRVDQRFNRARYDAEQELLRFVGRLRDEPDLDEITQGLLAASTRTMQPSAAAVWLRGTATPEGVASVSPSTDRRR